MNRRSGGALALLTAAGLMLAGCSAPGGDADTPDESGKTRITIGVTVNSTNAILTSGREGMEAYAAANNIELLYKSAEGDVATQASQVEDFVRAGVDAIQITAVTQDSLGPQIEAAAAAGIPVTVVNLDIEHKDIAGRVIQDDYTAARGIAAAAAEAIGGKGSVVMIQGPIGQSAQLLRDKGIIDELEENYPDIEIIASGTGEWQRDKAANLMSNWITAFGDKIDAVLAHNDDMALGASQALREKGMSLPVVGIDGTEDGLKAVEAGSMEVTMFMHGATIFATGLALTEAIVRGTAETTDISYEMPPVTKDNVNDYMANVFSDRPAFLKQLPEIIARNMKSGDYSDETRIG